MAASTIPVRPSAVEIARAAAAAIPSEVSTRPLLGILGVVTGAGLVTLAGRMLSLGLADLKGHVGIGFDNGVWLDSAYNASLMFIGPFSVYLGGLLGPRRILLFAAGLFTVTSIFLPFIHSYSLLVVALIVAGLTSGTFYPLTLTFALRNIPLRYLPFTIALYATFVDGAVNIAPSLYGWYRDHLSWHWMFWNSAVIAPVMMICVYFGIPRMPSRKKGGPAPSFVGFLYLSAGLALVFAALLLLPKHDPSLLFAIGLACTAFAAWLNSQYTSAWAAENLYRTELLTGLGQAFAFIGLVGCIVLQAIFAGALAKPEWVLSFSAFFHTIRLFGGTAGAIYMGHFIAQREKLHSELLGLHVSSGNWISDQNIHAMTAGLFAKSSSMAAAGARAIDLIAARLRLQAYSLSLVDGFLLIVWSCACALIFVALLRTSPLNYGELSNMQQIPAAHKESNQ